jgi:hypothetical protein
MTMPRLSQAARRLIDIGGTSRAPFFVWRSYTMLKGMKKASHHANAAHRQALQAREQGENASCAHSKCMEVSKTGPVVSNSQLC